MYDVLMQNNDGFSRFVLCVREEELGCLGGLAGSVEGEEARHGSG